MRTVELNCKQKDSGLVQRISFNVEHILSFRVTGINQTELQLVTGLLYTVLMDYDTVKREVSK